MNIGKTILINRMKNGHSFWDLLKITFTFSYLADAFIQSDLQTFNNVIKLLALAKINF